MKNTNLRWTLLAAAGSAALALAACHSSTENVETNVSNLDVNVIETNLAPENLATPAPVTNVTTAAPAAPGNDFDTARTQDDADATGMTARLPRDDNSSTPAQ